MNPMKELRIEKVTFNIGTGKDQNALERGVKLLTQITGVVPVKTITSKRIAAWGIRPGLPIGCKVTLRNGEASEALSRVLDAKSNTLKVKNFDSNGNLAFGIPEYIDIKGAKYDPEIGIMGLEVCVTFGRPGFRVKRRRIRPAKIPKSHRVNQQEVIEFMKSRFNVEVE